MSSNDLSVSLLPPAAFLLFFFFNDTATTEIYTLSLHDALPIPWTARPIMSVSIEFDAPHAAEASTRRSEEHTSELRHVAITYAVFCLKKKQGRKFAADEIVRRATGEAMCIKPYVDYLGRKYGELYFLF